MKIFENNIGLSKQNSNISTSFRSTKLVQQTSKTISQNSLKLASAVATAIGLASLAKYSSVKTPLVSTIPDGASLSRDVIYKLFEECYDTDFSCKPDVLNETLKKVSTAQGRDKSSRVIIDTIKTFGNLDDIAQKYPEFTEFFTRAVTHGAFETPEMQRFIKNGLKNNYLQPVYLDHYESFLNEGYILDEENSFEELYDKSSCLTDIKNSRSEDNFNTYSYATRNKILSSLLDFSIANPASEEIFIDFLEFLPEEKAVYFCDNPQELKDLSDKVVDFILNSSLSLILNTKIDDISEQTVGKLSLMKELYPQNFDALLNSGILKEIRNKTINHNILDHIDITQKADDKYLKQLVYDIEQNAQKNLDSISYIDSLKPAKLDLLSLQLNYDESEKITNSIKNSKDKALTAKVVKDISIYFSSDKEKDKKFIIDLLKICGENPQAARVILDFDRYDKTFIVSAIELFNRIKDVSIIENLSQKGIDKEIILRVVRNLTTKNHSVIEQYINSTSQIDLKHLAKLLALKHFSNLDDPIKFKEIIDNFNMLTKEFDDSFEQSKFREYLKNIYHLTPLLDMKIHSPQTFDKIKQSGYFDLCKTEDFGINYLRILNSNSDLSENVYNDLEKLRRGEEIVPNYPAQTSKKEVFAKTQCGDVAEIGEKLYINDGSQMIEWQMTKQKYLELFPPVKRFINLQRSMGDCYLISSFSSIMHNPKTRVDLYKSFVQDGDDILVTIKGYEDYKGTVRIDKSELPYIDKEIFLDGCKAMQFLEYAYALTTLREEGEILYKKEDFTDIYMERISGGKSYIAMSELLGLDMKNPDYVIPNNFSKASIDYLLSSCTESLLDTTFQKYANDKDYIVQIGTSDISEKRASILNLKYNIQGHHAHSIVGYDSTTKNVKVINPYQSGVITEVPISKLTNIISAITITSLN